MYRSSFHDKKIPKTNILVHLLTYDLILNGSGNHVLANLKGSKSKTLTLRPNHGRLWGGGGGGGNP